MWILLTPFVTLAFVMFMSFDVSDNGDIRDLRTYRQWGEPAKEMGFEADKQCSDGIFDVCYYSDTALPANVLANILAASNTCVSDRLRATVDEGTVISIAGVQDARQDCEAQHTEALLSQQREKNLAAQKKGIAEHYADELK